MLLGRRRLLVSCIDCDACVEACPVDAIFARDQVPAEWERYIELNAAYFADG